MPPLPFITNTSCNLRRNIETTQSKNVGRTGCKMQMQKQDNCQEMLYEGVKLQQKNLLLKYWNNPKLVLNAPTIIYHQYKLQFTMKY